MQMLYNSDNFAVVVFEVPAREQAPQAGEASGALTRGGYEIVDKFSRKEIYLEGAMAESFKAGVEALIQTSPSVEEIDAYIERFTSLMHQPVVLH
ncbi:DUF3567 domain-containing protein [Caldimonas sp.]|uniref:BTH_I0359 family protein n=1 Tax=Caldimonas sp. TaxID=2838790 RepID=UPI00391C5BC2